MMDGIMPRLRLGIEYQTLVIVLALAPALFSALALFILGIAGRIGDHVATNRKTPRKPSKKVEVSKARRMLLWLFSFFGALNSANGFHLGINHLFDRTFNVESFDGFVPRGANPLIDVIMNPAIEFIELKPSRFAQRSHCYSAFM